jgi:cyclophilin family peptidyl-prolyl cis-trans isomerase
MRTRAILLDLHIVPHGVVCADGAVDDSPVVESGQQFAPIPLERTSVTGLKQVDGAVLMARNGPDTATASFSIVIGEQLMGL